MTIQGTFHANTTYTVTVDGAILPASWHCHSDDLHWRTYAPAIIPNQEYSPPKIIHLRFRHREVSTITGLSASYREKNRYLFYSRAGGAEGEGSRPQGKETVQPGRSGYFHYIDAIRGDLYHHIPRVTEKR